MQLAKGLKPISLGICVITSQFSYADINTYLKNNTINSRINQVNNNQDSYDYYSIVVESQFQERLNKWEEETMFSSSVDEIINNKNFQWIINQKETVVPFIINEIDKHPSTLVWALNIIFDKSISKRQLTIADACKLWVKTLRK